MTDVAAVNHRIEAAFGSFSPRLRQAARYVLDQPEDVALNSMRMVASRAGVHPSTMVRLARELSFDSYNAFRQPYRRWLRGQPARFAARARALQARGRDDETRALLKELATTDMHNIEACFAGAGMESLVACVEPLVRARRIYVVGLRSCYPVAFYFHYACRMFRNRTVLLDGSGGTFADHLRGLGPEDAMLAVSFAPYSRETVKAAEYAAHHRAGIVAVTDSRLSPLARTADHALVVASSSPSFFPSIVPAVAAVEALVTLMVGRSGESALAAIDESERQLASFDAYVDDTVLSVRRP